MYKDEFDISIIYAARYRGVNADSVHSHDSLFQLYILNNDRLELFDGEISYIPDHLSEIVLIKPSEKHCLRLVEPAETQDWLDDDINCLLDCKFSVSDHELYKKLMNLPRIIKVTDISFFADLQKPYLNIFLMKKKIQLKQF
ncbi:MAG: hypothetical protein IKW59_06020 [Clostridia bacterium]|nr:hypothetical protein [Clostridia bacterium]